MKPFFLSFLLMLPLGWLGLGVLYHPSEDTAQQVEVPAEQASLLGSRAPETEPVPSLDVGNGLEGSLEFLETVNNASPKTLECWILELIKADGGQTEYRRLQQLLGQYGELDPEGALAFIAEHPELTNYRRNVLSAWAGKDWQAAAEKALELEPKGHLIYGVMQVVDADAALELHDFLKEKGFDKSAPGQFANLFSHLYALGAENAAEKALAHLRSQPRSHMGDHGLSNVLGNWSKDDPEAALAWVDGQSSGADKDLAMNGLISAWVERDSLGALEALWYRADVKQRDRLVDRLENGGDRGIDTAKALAWLDEHVEAPEWRNKVLSGLVEGLRNSSSPQQLAELVPHLDASDNTAKNAITQAARRWAESDLDGLNTWMEMLDDVGVREAVLGGMIKQLAVSQPNKALEYLKDDSIGEEVLGQLSGGDLGRILQSANGAPMELIEQLPESMRAKALEGYAESFAEENPAEVLNNLESMPEGEARDKGIQRSVSHWATVAPQEAAAWVDGLPEGILKRYASLNLVNNWSRSDLAAAQVWLETQSPGQSRDAAAVQLAQAKAAVDPAAALELMQSLGPAEENDYRRDEAISETITALARVDATRAEEALLQIELSERTRERLEKTLKETVALQDYFANLEDS